MLYDAADALRKAADSFDDGVQATRRATEFAMEEWRGAAADAANEQYLREVRDGRQSIDALRAMRNVLD